MKSKKILFLTRGSSNTISGGDVVQLKNTAHELQSIGYTVLITNDISQIDLFEPDIVHFSGINLQHNISDIVRKVEKVRLSGLDVKLVMSTIYVNYEGYERNVRKSTVVNIVLFLFGYLKLEYLKETLRLGKLNFSYLMDFLFKPPSHVYERYLKHVDLFLPNSFLEADEIVKDFNVPKDKIKVVTNGCNLSEYQQMLSLPYNNFVLCVARIEELKNQINLIKACKLANLNLILVGSLSISQRGYYEKLFEHLDDKRIYIGPLPHDELIHYYKACSIHALVSHFETCGLSTMEAIHFNKNVVVSDVGYVRSVFGDIPTYCNPDSVDSISSALKIAMKKEVDNDLYMKFISGTNWSVAAKQTHIAYMELF